MWVRYAPMGEDKPVGMGVRFVGLDGKGIEVIRSLIAFEVESAKKSAAEVFSVEEAESRAAAAAVEHADVFPKPGETGVGFFAEQEAARAPSGRGGWRWLLAVAGILAGIAGVVFFAVWYGAFPGLLPGTAELPAGDRSAVATPATGSRGAVPVSAPATLVMGIAWTVKEGETVVTISGDADFSPAAVSTSRLRDPARFVLRLSGIVEPYRPSEIPSAAPGMRGIRVGHHAGGGEPQLHVVLDLESETDQVGEVEFFGDTLAVRVVPDR
jgi:hypothetical protein